MSFASPINDTVLSIKMLKDMENAVAIMEGNPNMVSRDSLLALLLKSLLVSYVKICLFSILFDLSLLNLPL